MGADFDNRWQFAGNSYILNKNTERLDMKSVLRVVVDICGVFREIRVMQ